MLIPALAALAAAFLLLLLLRLGGARRAALARHAAPLALGVAATYAAVRGQFAGAAALALCALALWLWGGRGASTQAPSPDALSEVEARAILGVGPEASASEIRAAYREKMKRAHPDRGGSTQAAARLNAARALLLRR